RSKNKKRCLELVELLVRLADEQGDAAMKTFYGDMLDNIRGGEAISRSKLNAAVVVASTGKKDKDRGSSKPGKTTQLYDMVLVEPGDSMILLIRELRELTGKSLRAVSDIVAMSPAPIG